MRLLVSLLHVMIIYWATHTSGPEGGKEKRTGGADPLQKGWGLGGVNDSSGGQVRSWREQRTKGAGAQSSCHSRFVSASCLALRVLGL